jgi:hypothetical protein
MMIDGSNKTIRLALIAQEWGWLGGVLLAYGALLRLLIIWSLW